MELTPEHLKRLNIGKRYWDAEVDKITGKPGVILGNMVKELEAVIREGLGLFLYGRNDTGKTYAASAFLKEAQRAGYTGYATLNDVLIEAYKEKSRYDSYQLVSERVRSVDILFLDDVGKEYIGSGSGYAELQLENLLRHRNQELKPTILTSNLSPKDFKLRYKKSAFSVVFESLKMIQMSDSGHRKVNGIALEKRFECKEDD